MTEIWEVTLLPDPGFGGGLKCCQECGADFVPQTPRGKQCGAGKRRLRA